MKSNLKGILIGLTAAVILFIIYLNFDSISTIFQSKAKRNVDKFLTVMNNENPNTDEIKSLTEIMDKDYIRMLSHNSYYKISSWKISKSEDDPLNNKYTLIYVEGKIKNAFGAELNRNPIFVVSEDSKIIDSYKYIALEKYSELNKSDMGVYRLLEGLKENVKIESWSWQSDYSIYSPGRVEGKATIYNGAEVPVSFVKLEITYYDNAGNVLNTDDTYAVGADDLQPGQRRVVTWSTYNCEGASSANVNLSFN